MYFAVVITEPLLLVRYIGYLHIDITSGDERTEEK